MLPHYSKKVTAYQIETWRKNFNYEAFNDCITNLLEEKNVHVKYRRRMLDYFMWYPNRKNQNLSEHNVAL
ncbi:MAG: hypothetical protein HFH09_03250 [Bacilli bacterium]|jgi:hypothetical protein|nr:hypothetical protein [Bacilli bacterium]